MRFVPTQIPGVVEVQPDVHGDERGFFLETYRSDKYRDGGITATFVQDNHSRSKRGILRGLHLQLKQPQAKLVRVVEGEVFDVAVDVRRGSPTFGRHVSAILSATNFKQLYVPAGFAHGFVVTSDVAEFEYKCSAFYDPSDEISIAWDDPELAIPWPISNPSVSDRDAAALTLSEISVRLPQYVVESR